MGDKTPGVDEAENILGVDNTAAIPGVDDKTSENEADSDSL